MGFALNEGTSSPSDRELILACRKGKVQAWQRLLDKYERIVYSIPRKYGLSVEDAADVTQLTFTILVESIDRLPEDSKLGGWLTTVARRHTWRALERNRRQGIDRYAVLDENIASAGEDADALERWELTEWLNQGISRVSTACRKLLFALYLDPEQPSYAEIASRMNMAVGSVGPTRIRCLERLRREMDD